MEENTNTFEKIDEKENNPSRNSDDKNPKKIEVVNGDGDLTISPVYEHLEIEKPKPKENKKIFIPEVKNTSNNNDTEPDKK